MSIKTSVFKKSHRTCKLSINYEAVTSANGFTVRDESNGLFFWHLCPSRFHSMV